MRAQTEQAQALQCTRPSYKSVLDHPWRRYKDTAVAVSI